jgi:porin
VQRSLGFPENLIYDYEAVIEVSYRAQLTAWWTLQPDFQYVMHPGGNREFDDAFVFSLFTTLRF